MFAHAHLQSVKDAVVRRGIAGKRAPKSLIHNKGVRKIRRAPKGILGGFSARKFEQVDAPSAMRRPGHRVARPCASVPGTMRAGRTGELARIPAKWTPVRRQGYAPAK